MAISLFLWPTFMAFKRHHHLRCVWPWPQGDDGKRELDWELPSCLSQEAELLRLVNLPYGYDCYIAMVKPWPIEIAGLPFLKMVDLSMAMLVITRWYF